MQSGLIIAAVMLSALVACNSERAQECEKFVSAMSPIKSDAPSADTVDRIRDNIDRIHFQDEPLHEYAKSYKGTLTVLSNALKLKSSAGPDGPPDGTEDLIKANLKEVRTNFDDLSWYCAQ